LGCTGTHFLKSGQGARSPRLADNHDIINYSRRLYCRDESSNVRRSGKCSAVVCRKTWSQMAGSDGRRTRRRDVEIAVSNSLNYTFPACLRRRAWPAPPDGSGDYDLEALNRIGEGEVCRELVVHLRREVVGSRYGGKWTAIRTGEAIHPSPEDSANLDLRSDVDDSPLEWVIAVAKEPVSSAEKDHIDEVLIEGATGVVAGTNWEPQLSERFVRRLRWLAEKAPSTVHRMAYLLFNCTWEDRTNLEASIGTKLELVRHAVRHKTQFSVDVEPFKPEETQVVTGWPWPLSQREFSESDRRMAHLQVLLECRRGESAWTATPAPPQHQLDFVTE